MFTLGLMAFSESSAESSFGRANVVGPVNHLALQIAGLDHIKVHDPQRPHARRRKVHSQRRAQSSRTDTQHTRGLQFQLALFAHLRQNQVSRISRHLFRSQRTAAELEVAAMGAPPAIDGMIDSESDSLTGAFSLLRDVTNVFVVQIHVDEGSQLSLFRIKMFA